MSEKNFQQYGGNTIDSSDEEELPNFEIVFNFNREVSGELNTEEENNLFCLQIQVKKLTSSFSVKSQKIQS